MYSMFDLKASKNGIFYYENVFSYEDELMQFIDEMDKTPQSHSRIPAWEKWTSSNDSNHVYGVQKFFHENNFNHSTGDEMIDMKTLYIYNSLKMAPEMCAQYFARVSGIDKSEIDVDTSMISLRRYDTGQSMGPHYDGQDGDEFLKYTMVIYLNDDYEGGEVNFPNHDLTIKPKAGSLVLFPSQKPYIHESKPIISGNKYMYTAHWVDRSKMPQR